MWAAAGDERSSQQHGEGAYRTTATCTHATPQHECAYGWTRGMEAMQPGMLRALQVVLATQPVEWAEAHHAEARPLNHPPILRILWRDGLLGLPDVQTAGQCAAPTCRLESLRHRQYAICSPGLPHRVQRALTDMEFRRSTPSGAVIAVTQDTKFLDAVPAAANVNPRASTVLPSLHARARTKSPPRRSSVR